MSDMFGAPIGIGAAEADQRQNVLGGLQAAKVMGEIAMQPAQQALAQAHARLFTSEAAGKEQDADANAAMAKFAQGLPLAAKATGSPLDAMSALAYQQLQVGQFAVNQGYFKQGLPIIKEGADAIYKVSQTLSEKALQAHREFQARSEQLQQQGAEAGAVLSMGSQAEYDNWKMHKTSNKEDVSDLPPDLASAKSMLQPIYTSSIKAVDQLKAKAKALVDAAQIKKDEAQAVAAGASAGASSARTKVLKLREADIIKNGGDTSNGARAARNAHAAAAKEAEADRKTAQASRQAAQATRDKINFKGVSAEEIADPAKIPVGDTRYLPGIGPATYTGKKGAEWIPLHLKAYVPPTKSTPLPAEDASDVDFDY